MSLTRDEAKNIIERTLKLSKADEASPAIGRPDKRARRNDHDEAADHEEQVDPAIAVVPRREIGCEVVVQQQGAVESDDEQRSERPQALN